MTNPSAGSGDLKFSAENRPDGVMCKTDFMGQITNEFINVKVATMDKAIHQKLVELGWTPPAAPPTPEATAPEPEVGELLPCPFCGELLVYKEDHHGNWWAHKDEPGPCHLSTTQLFDEVDFAEWNRRAPSTITTLRQVQDLKDQVEKLLMSNGRKDAMIATYMSAIASESRAGRRDWAVALIDKADTAALRVKREDLVVAHLNSTQEQTP